MAGKKQVQRKSHELCEIYAYVEKMPDLASHHTPTSTNEETSYTVPFTTV